MNKPYCLFESLSRDKENKDSFLFDDFLDVLVFRCGDDPVSFFRKAESYIQKGYWLAGYFNYEFGYFLDEALAKLRTKEKIPLAWLGVSKKPKAIQIKNNPPYRVSGIRPNIAEQMYAGKIKKIKGYLAQGLTYQVNYTFKLKFDFAGSPQGLYRDLCLAQPTSYAALINTGQRDVISLSPELFFRTRKNRITVRPMKGTASSSRGLRSKKNLAENLMIVDLLRNDLGRISEKVRVPRLFSVEKYRTLNQMTSTIKARLSRDINLKDFFTALYPSGSVTGAPKIKTMELIKSLEKEPRGVYTGAIGYLSKERSCFNVAIRTLEIKNGNGQIGIGGGIVYDSKPESEYQEALLKAKFFTGLGQPSLIETILLKDKKYYLLDLHLRRLAKSAKEFSYDLNLKALKTKLKNSITAGKFKVKAVLSPKGKIRVEKELLVSAKMPVKITLSSGRIDPANPWLYHKTTQRDFYDRQLKAARKRGFFEVIFLNKKNQVSEGAISNIFIKKGKTLYTPPLKCGLLAGVLRQDLLSRGKVKERVLYLKDLYSADKIYIGNSVRGLLEARLADKIET